MDVVDNGLYPCLVKLTILKVIFVGLSQDNVSRVEHIENPIQFVGLVQKEIIISSKSSRSRL
jgi:hypothetical protein